MHRSSLSLDKRRPHKCSAQSWAAGYGVHANRTGLKPMLAWLLSLTCCLLACSEPQDILKHWEPRAGANGVQRLGVPCAAWSVQRATARMVSFHRLKRTSGEPVAPASWHRAIMNSSVTPSAAMVSPPTGALSAVFSTQLGYPLYTSAPGNDRTRGRQMGECHWAVHECRHRPSHRSSRDT